MKDFLIVCFAVRQSKSKAGCLCSRKIGFLFLWRTLCMGAPMEGVCVCPSQNKTKLQNIVHTQMKYFFSQNSFGVQTQMPRSNL